MRSENGEPHIGKVMTVFGARGGIGKSTIATNVSAVIAQRTDASVLLMDMDTRFGDVAMLLNVEPTYTVADLASHPGDLTPELFRQALVAHESGAYVLAAPVAPSAWARITAEQIQRVVRFAAHEFDYVVLDTPGTVNDIVATALEVADQVFVVCGLDTASIKHTAQMFDLLEGSFPLDRMSIVLNQLSPVITVRPKDVESTVGHEAFWSIPYDAQIPVTQALGEPIVTAHPKSKAAKQLLGLGLKVAGAPAAETTNWRGFFSRLNPWARSNETKLRDHPTRNAA